MPLVPWVLASLDLSSVGAAVEIGSADGRFTLPLARALAEQEQLGERGPVVHAVDRDMAALQRLRALADGDKLSIVTKCTTLPDSTVEANNSIDLVLAPFVLHQLRPLQAEEVLGDVRGWLRPPGSLVVVSYGARHMRETYDWLAEALSRTGLAPQEARERADQLERSRTRRPGFALAGAVGTVGRHFDSLTFRRFDDQLRAPVNAVEELVGPVLIREGRRQGDISASVLQPALASVLTSQATDGLLTLSVDIGLVTAANPRQCSLPRVNAGRPRAQR